MIDVTTALATLARHRPIFHSEADFQHALAWRLHEQEPTARVRLEYRPFADTPLYLDLWIEHENTATAIELKYPTRRIQTAYGGEDFSLKNHAAQLPRRYDFVKDIERIEQVVNARRATTGYAILLTNDSAFWASSSTSATKDEDFRVHEGTMLTGALTWAKGTGQGTMKGREQAISLRGAYLLRWQDYSTIATSNGRGRFRALIVKILPAETSLA